MCNSAIQRKKRRESHRVQFKSLGNHEEFLERITKTLYYAELPSTERFSLPLSELAVEIYSEVKYGKSLDRLTMESASEITRNACISPCSLVLALIYLEQLKTSNPDYIDEVSPSDLFVISHMAASKFLNDSGEEDDVVNSEWAASAGYSVSNLNKLEKEFLNAIDWKVFVKDCEFWTKLRSVEQRVGLREGRKRGWFSYTEMESLLDHLNALLLTQALFTVSAVCLASYTAGVLTMIGSTMVATHLTYLPVQPLPPIHSINTNITHFDQPPSFIQSTNGSQNECSNYLDYYCLEDNDLTPTAPRQNISDFYKNLLIPMSYNLLRFPRNWKETPMFLFTH